MNTIVITFLFAITLLLSGCVSPGHRATAMLRAENTRGKWQNISRQKEFEFFADGELTAYKLTPTEFSVLK